MFTVLQFVRAEEPWLESLFSNRVAALLELQDQARELAQKAGEALAWVECPELAEDGVGVLLYLPRYIWNDVFV